MGEKSNSRDLIVETAARLFFSQGYHATGLSQIIKESDTPKGSLYHYFPNGKEELAYVCIEKTNEHVLEKFKAVFEQHQTTGDAIQTFIRDMADDTEKSGFTGFLPFSFWAAVETSCISNKLRSACQDVFTDWQEVIADRLQQEGALEVRAKEAALLMISMMEGALIISLTNQSKQPMLTAADYLSAMMKTAVLTK